MVRGSKVVRPSPTAPLAFLTRSWGTALALDCIEEEFGVTVKVRDLCGHCREARSPSLHSHAPATPAVCCRGHGRNGPVDDGRDQTILGFAGHRLAIHRSSGLYSQGVFARPPLPRGRRLSTQCHAASSPPQIRAALLVLLAQQLLDVRVPRLLQRNPANDAALKLLAKDVAATRERRKTKQTLQQAFAMTASDDPANWHYATSRYALDVRAALRRLRHARFIEIVRDAHGPCGRALALVLLQGGANTKASAVAAAVLALQAAQIDAPPDAADATSSAGGAAQAAAAGVPPPPPPMLLKRKRSASTASLDRGASDAGGGAGGAPQDVRTLRARVRRE